MGLQTVLRREYELIWEARGVDKGVTGVQSAIEWTYGGTSFKVLYLGGIASRQSVKAEDKQCSNALEELLPSSMNHKKCVPTFLIVT